MSEEKKVTFFDKLPFKGMMEKIPAEKRAKAPILDKLIPWANQIVCGLAVILIIIIIVAASGGGPKSLAKETYKLYKQTSSVGTNPVKAAAVLIKMEKLTSKVEKLSGDKQAVYYAELTRLMGGNLGDIDLPGIDLSSPPASGTASKQADFTFQLTKDGTGVIITGVSGNPKEVKIPAKFEGVPVVEIGDEAFRGRTGITSITIPNSVTKIGDLTFAQSGINKIVIPDSVTEIGVSAFLLCKMLTEIKLPDNISQLHKVAGGGGSLKKINLPKNLKEISLVGFTGCDELTDLVIPDTITKLTFFTYDSKGNVVPLREDTIPVTFRDCQKLPIKTRQKLQQLGYTGEF